MAQKPFNKIALLLFALPIPTLGLACSHPSDTIRTEDVKASASKKYTSALGAFQNLKGTPYLMSAVTSTGWRSDKFSSSESYSSGEQTHNLVFLDTNSLESHRLFGSNAYVILQTDRYTQTIKSKAVTQWLVHQVIKSDTDGNKRLDRNDLIALGISSASGKKYVEVLTGITDILGLTMVTPGKLVVVYSKSGAKSASNIDLEKRSVTTTQPIIELGPEVK
jgi:hypothetical protein